MQSNEAYLEKSEKAYLEAISMLEDMSCWEVYDSCDELAAYTRRSPSGLDILKIEFFVDKDVEKVCNFIYNNFCELHNELNTDIVSDSGIVAKYGEDSRIRFEIINPNVPGVSRREIVYFGIKMQVSENVFALIETSVEPPERPMIQDTVRAEVIYVLHIFEKMNGMCHVLSVGYGDPKGSIPKSVVNFGIRKRVDFYKVIIKEILKSVN